jgi:hypothetical protein
VWAVKTGQNAFKKTHNGLSEFEWLKLNPAEEDKFSKAMKEVDSMGTSPSIDLQALPLSESHADMLYLLCFVGVPCLSFWHAYQISGTR